jgi:haloacetate dehalogenase
MGREGMRMGDRDDEEGDNDLADLFPGFRSHWIDTDAGRIFARSGGMGPALLLIHGFPQTHVMWHAIAPHLSRFFTLVIPDLRGYGWSSTPSGDAAHQTYSKRAMGADLVRVMETLGHIRFGVIGHDRGGRVGYRLALDHPGRVERLAVLDISPTVSMWDTMDAKKALQVYHWAFLAQPSPMPERLIGAHPTFWLDHTIASWTRDKSLAGFDPRALSHYRAFFNAPERIHACCEDYRAGATIDVAHDRLDLEAKKTITCPTFVLWGSAGIPAAGGPLGQWRETFAPEAQGQAIDAGHFVAEENPEASLKALMPFLGSH